MSFQTKVLNTTMAYTYVLIRSDVESSKTIVINVHRRVVSLIHSSASNSRKELNCCVRSWLGRIFHDRPPPHTHNFPALIYISSPRIKPSFITFIHPSEIAPSFSSILSSVYSIPPYLHTSIPRVHILVFNEELN